MAPVSGVLADSHDRPNVVLIVADDLGWTDLGCYGSGYYETPNIDRLAGEGMRFTDAYANPNCAPTRASLLTGMYTPRHGIYTVGSGNRGKEENRKMNAAPNETVLAAGFLTLGEVFKEAGYATASMGKWHMGSGDEVGPRGQGFDVNVGGNIAGHPPSYFSPYQNPDLKDGPAGEYLTDRLGDDAVRFIRHSAGGPFFLYLPFYSVHTPIQPREDLLARFADKPASGGHGNPEYAAMVAALDENVGKVLGVLDELDLTRKTLVVFMSDNGGLGGYGRERVGSRDLTDNAPLRGGKGMLYEGGVRVPTIVRWPGVTPARSETSTPIVCVDWLPTFMGLLGREAAADSLIDGVSLAPLLADPRANLKRSAIYWHFPGYLEGDRDGRTWRTKPASAIRMGGFKLIEFFESGTLELYNLKNDPGESRDLAREQLQVTRRLYRQLKDWRQRLSAPLPKDK
jgi:arylsulfatase A-like enzyme